VGRERVVLLVSTIVCYVFLVMRMNVVLVAFWTLKSHKTKIIKLTIFHFRLSNSRDSYFGVTTLGRFPWMI